MTKPNLPDAIVSPIGHVFGRAGPPGKNIRDHLVGLLSQMVLGLFAGTMLESSVIIGGRAPLRLAGITGAVSGIRAWPSQKLPERRAQPETIQSLTTVS